MRPRFGARLALPSGRGEQVVLTLGHLLNADAYLLRRFGAAVTTAERLEIALSVADGLATLHRHEIVVGELTPANILVSLSAPHETAFADCDGMLFRGKAVRDVPATPGWCVPAWLSDDASSPAADVYKLALVVVRLLARNSSATALPPASARTASAGISDHLRRVVERGLAEPETSLANLQNGLLDALDRSSREPGARTIGAGGRQTPRRRRGLPPAVVVVMVGYVLVRAVITIVSPSPSPAPQATSSPSLTPQATSTRDASASSPSGVPASTASSHVGKPRSRPGTARRFTRPPTARERRRLIRDVGIISASRFIGAGAKLRRTDVIGRTVIALYTSIDLAPLKMYVLTDTANKETGVPKLALPKLGPEALAAWTPWVRPEPLVKVAWVGKSHQHYPSADVRVHLYYLLGLPFADPALTVECWSVTRTEHLLSGFDGWTVDTPAPPSGHRVNPRRCL
jgi:hypothetical protein